MHSKLNDSETVLKISRFPGNRIWLNFIRRLVIGVHSLSYRHHPIIYTRWYFFDSCPRTDKLNTTSSIDNQRINVGEFKGATETFSRISLKIPVLSISVERYSRWKRNPFKKRNNNDNETRKQRGERGEKKKKKHDGQKWEGTVNKKRQDIKSDLITMRINQRRFGPRKPPFRMHFFELDLSLRSKHFHVVLHGSSEKEKSKKTCIWR